ncbi:MAG: hypothetical protein A4E65_01308 [Syntrophorhabdus sp. PtaU1.Bin153]|nr:MAG: hypothetical protein A4E65_01308 [Syntrophorhabdus sp. PtaU1.Bin153]
MNHRYGIAFRSCIAIAFCLTICFLGIPVVFAGEGYGTHVPIGAEDFMAGALPPGGTKVFINYFQLYNPNKLKDNAGRNQSVPGLGKLDAKTDVVANCFRFIDVTKIKLLGGDLIWDIIVPVVYQHTNLSAGPADLAIGNKTGLGDVEGGVGISWHPSPTFHNILALHAVAPTGSYQKGDDVNIGRNYWSFNPLWLATYIGGKDSPLPGFEVSAKFMYWVNTTNTATHYTSGQEFSIDYLIGQHFGKTWSFGANGNFYYQLTKDKEHGHTALDPFSGKKTGVQGRSLSIGPALQYNFPNQGCLTAKYQFEVDAHNRPLGNLFWLKLVWPF